MTKRAVLLANLGSPDAPETRAVRRYLNQFLMDRYVIQLPWLLRRLIVSLFVLPTRPKASAEAYQSVWMDEGSPLIVLSEQLKQAVQKKVDMPLEMAMRYGNPSIEKQLGSNSAKTLRSVKFSTCTALPAFCRQYRHHLGGRSRARDRQASA